MKKKIAVIALAAFAILGTVAYLHAHAVTNSRPGEGTSNLSGLKCSMCNGTGFRGNYHCSYCNGTGRNASY